MKIKTFQNPIVAISTAAVVVGLAYFIGFLFRPIQVNGGVGYNANKVIRLDLERAALKSANELPPLSAKSLPYYPIGAKEYFYSDVQDNGTSGGFTLLRVTQKQWEFLKERGLRLHILGNVMDTRYPKDFGPILMTEGFLVFYKDADQYDFLKDTDPKPDLFWVAIRTDKESYQKK